jgi:hypothetical protein
MGGGMWGFGPLSGGLRRWDQAEDTITVEADIRAAEVGAAIQAGVEAEEDIREVGDSSSLRASSRKIDGSRPPMMLLSSIKCLTSWGRNFRWMRRGFMRRGCRRAGL